MLKKKINMHLETFSCSVCLGLLKDPVTIPCGHSYCKRCIKEAWDRENQRKIYSCPQCRKKFKLRPLLEKNTILAELVEELGKTDLQAVPAGPEDVPCDICSDRKLKAVKSCLNCLASYCEKHLRPHHEAPPLQKHQLVEASKNLQENICPRHDEVMKLFCRTDQQCICYLCTMDQHKGHETVSAAAERAEKQKELEETRQQIQQRIQEREKDVKLLQQQVEASNFFTDTTEEDSEKVFTQLIRLIQERSSDRKLQLRSQLETEVSHVKELREKLEQDLTDLKRQDSQLEQLSHTQDHTQFLHNYPSVSALSECPHSSTKTRPRRYFENVTAAVDQLGDKMQDVLRDTWTNVSRRVSQVDVLLPEPTSRDEFLRYSQEITLDPNTAHRQLLLSDEDRKATSMKQNQSYPDHPDRFRYYNQVLSRERLSGRCYWEVEWGVSAVNVAVTYKNISSTRGSGDFEFGFNDQSWALSCKTNSYAFWHNKRRTPVSGPASCRIGVYLDHRAGVLSFYSVSDTMTLLHRVQTTFTQPLHAGLLFYDDGDTAEFIKLK